MDLALLDQWVILLVFSGRQAEIRWLFKDSLISQSLEDLKCLVLGLWAFLIQDPRILGSPFPGIMLCLA